MWSHVLVLYTFMKFLPQRRRDIIIFPFASQRLCGNIFLIINVIKAEKEQPVQECDPAFGRGRRHQCQIFTQKLVNKIFKRLAVFIILINFDVWQKIY
jgi:hypothetical protein